MRWCRRASVRIRRHWWASWTEWRSVKTDCVLLFSVPWSYWFGDVRFRDHGSLCWWSREAHRGCSQCSWRKRRCFWPWSFAGVSLGLWRFRLLVPPWLRLMFLELFYIINIILIFKVLVEHKGMLWRICSRKQKYASFIWLLGANPQCRRERKDLLSLGSAKTERKWKSVQLRTYIVR